MGLFHSEAESIYKAWNTGATSAAVTPQARAGGAFDTYRKDGGFDAITTRLITFQKKKGTRATAEQIWKLLDKIKRRKGDIIAREVLKVLNADTKFKGILDQFPATMFRNLSDVAVGYAATLDPNHVIFENTGKRVKVLKKLGAGGMGGAVFLAQDGAGNKYALKHFVRDRHKIAGYGGTTPRSMLDRSGEYLMKYFEAALTTTCIDALTIGRDEYVLLQLGEGAVDYTKLNMSDIQSVFLDMQKLYDFGKHYMGVEVTQEVSVLHMDIHGENFMRFDGKLRLIDFGQAMIFSPGQDEMVRAHEIVKYDRNNKNLYFQNAGAIEDKKRAYAPDAGSWKKYIDDWQKAYTVAPIVQVCKGCARQYPAGLSIKQCFRCGSSKIETSRLRRQDIEATARLRGTTPSMIGDNPYAHGRVNSVNPQQYGCIVLTAVLIKEIWAAAEAGTDKGMGGTAARAIQNVEVYSLARSGQYKFKAEGQATIIELLLLWYDEMMRRLFDGETFTARDGAAFFGGGTRGAQPSRSRRHSVSF